MKLRLLIKGIFIAFFVFYLTPLIAQTENKTVVITVSGSGKTQEEAKQNALRNAIEQAFGTFISSNTQILNDELVKDEIVSVSSGNIQEYSVLSEVQAPDGYWSNTVQAKVSIDKLTKFCESKGVTAELKGSLFASNIKLVELNKKNEETAVENMCLVLKEISEGCFDYQIEVGEPSSAPSGNPENKGKWRISFKIVATPNNNLKIIEDYFIKTLEGLTLDKNEIDNYKKLNVKAFSLLIELSDSKNKTNITARTDKKSKNKTLPDSSVSPLKYEVTLRSEVSIQSIEDFLKYFSKSLLNFEVVSNFGSKLGHDFFERRDENYYNERATELYVTDNGFTPYFINQYNKKISVITNGEYNSDGKAYTGYFLQPASKKRGFAGDSWRSGIPYSSFGTIVFNNDSEINNKIELSYSETMTTNEISKITGYKITFQKNRIYSKIIDERYHSYYETIVKE